MENLVLNDVWGLEIAIEMTFLAIASFSIVLAYLSYLEGRIRDALIGGIVATVLPILSLIILNLHLLKPEAAYLVFTSFQPRSWMPWGATGITLLIVSSALFTLLAKYGRQGLIVNLVGVIASLIGILVALYTGLVLAYERGIPFWHSAIVPIISLLMGIIGGASVYTIIRPSDTRITLTLGVTLLLLLVAYIAHIHLALIGPRAASYSAQVALENPLFIIGALLALIGGAIGLTTLKIKTQYIAVVLAATGLIAILLLRVVLLTSGAWELPII